MYETELYDRLIEIFQNLVSAEKKVANNVIKVPENERENGRGKI